MSLAISDFGTLSFPLSHMLSRNNSIHHGEPMPEHHRQLHRILNHISSLRNLTLHLHILPLTTAIHLHTLRRTNP